jgi:hypothetical protein
LASPFLTSENGDTSVGSIDFGKQFEAATGSIGSIDPIGSIGMLDCTVCFEPLDSAWMCCTNDGHVVCAECAPKLAKCHFCRKEGRFERKQNVLNAALDKLREVFSSLQRRRDDVSNLVYENGQLDQLLSEAHDKLNARSRVDAKRRLRRLENDNQSLRRKLATLQTRFELITNEQDDSISSSRDA